MQVDRPLWLSGPKGNEQAATPNAFSLPVSLPRPAIKLSFLLRSFVAVTTETASSDGDGTYKAKTRKKKPTASNVGMKRTNGRGVLSFNCGNRRRQYVRVKEVNVQALAHSKENVC